MIKKTLIRMKKTFTLLLVLFMFLPFVMEAQLVPLHVKVTQSNGVTITMDGLQGNFGPNFPATMTGQVAVTTDGVTEPTDGDTWSAVGAYTCEPISNPDEINGKIALISRGACGFSNKVQAATDAGAVAVIVMNRAPLGMTIGTHTDGLVWMAGGDLGPSITTPNLFISYEDRLILENLMAEDPNLEVTIEKPGIYDFAFSRAASVPEGQGGVLDSISMVVINRDTTVLKNLTFTVAITEPSGNVVSLTSTLDTLPPPAADASGEVLVQFEGYSPTEVGTYEATFSAGTTDGNHPLDTENVTATFEINDQQTFKMDNGQLGDYPPIQIREEAYLSSANLIFNVGSFFKTGGSTEAFAASFALANPGDLAVGMPFTFSLYDADPDGDGSLDNNGDGNIDEIDLLMGDPVAQVDYIITGTETANSLLSVAFPEIVDLTGNHDYLLMVSHFGLEADNFTPPAYTVAGYENYTGFGTVYEYGAIGTETYAFDVDGFEYWNDADPTVYTGFPHGGAHPVVRLHTTGFVIDGIKDLPALEASKIQVAPNPATVTTQLTFDLDEVAADVKVKLFDITGRLVNTYNYENVQKNTFDINVKDLTMGTYFLSIVTPEGYSVEKLVVGQ